MSDRSCCTLTIDEAPDPWGPALAAIVEGAESYEVGEFVWEEVALSTASDVAAALRQAAPDLAFTITQEARYEFDGYRITAAAGRPLREVTLSASGRVVIDAHVILDLLAGASSADAARSAVRAHLEAEGAL